MPTVTFLEVKTNPDKLAAISRTVQHHYAREEAVLIVVPNAEAAHYIDQLLWKPLQRDFCPMKWAQKNAVIRYSLPHKRKISIRPWS